MISSPVSSCGPASIFWENAPAGRSASARPARWICAGKEKPLFAQRQALWTDSPVIRLAVSDAASEDRGAWGECFRWEGTPGEKKRVSCYTNGGAAELFLNGKSLGKKTLKETDGGRAIWVIPYEEGILEARTEGASDLLATPGKACSLKWIRNASQPGEDVIQLEAGVGPGRPACRRVIICQGCWETWKSWVWKTACRMT